MKHISDEEKEVEKTKPFSKDNIEPYYSTYHIAREKNRDAYKPWTPNLDEELTILFCEGSNVRDLSKHFGRTKGAIRSRIKKLELEEKYG